MSIYRKLNNIFTFNKIQDKILRVDCSNCDLPVYVVAKDYVAGKSVMHDNCDKEFRFYKQKITEIEAKYGKIQTSS